LYDPRPASEAELELDPAEDPFAHHAVRHLVARYGSPLLIIDLMRVRAQYRRLAAALPGVDLHFALKPLPQSAVIRTLQHEGAFFDLATNGEVDLVRRLGSQTPAGQSALAEVDGAINRLERLIQQLVTLARADEQTIAQPTIENVDLNEIAFNVLSERAPQAIARDIDVQFDRFEGRAIVRGNSLLIGELLANLVDNAIRYNRAGGLILVRTFVDLNEARVEIEDSGPGIPAAHLGRVFERFYRIPMTNGPEGSGLGLAIVKALADRLQAQIVLSSRREGQGLLASVRFPLAKGDQENS